MSNPLSRYESLVERQIRAAQERGEFDDLPGTGKPLPGWGTPDDELWWVRQLARRERLPTEGLLPTALQLARELEVLGERVLRLPSEPAVREHVGDLNGRIAEYLRAPYGPYVALRPADPDDLVRRWQEARRRTDAVKRAADSGGATAHAVEKTADGDTAARATDRRTVPGPRWWWRLRRADRMPGA